MRYTAGQQIKGVMAKKDITMTELATRLGYSRQNLSNKLTRDNFTEKEIEQISKALDTGYRITIDDDVK